MLHSKEELFALYRSSIFVSLLKSKNIKAVRMAEARCALQT
jgi:hypothetical protein